MHLRLRDTLLDLREPVVMGVLNVTPDSFSDGGRLEGSGAAIEHGLRLAGEGAAILDVGGESTRPGAEPVSVEEELRRVLPVIEGLASRTRVPVSVDTSKPEVMRAAIAAGASFVNDVRALEAPGAIEVVAETGAGVCLMHMKGTPATMQSNPVYSDATVEVRDYLVGRRAACLAAGIAAERICVDPGIGFGKTSAHNLALLADLGGLAPSGVPVLVGVSRKSLVGIITGRGPAGRLAGSVAFAALAVTRGASIVRAHDVAETVDAVRVAAALMRAPGAGGSA
ncbi:MAG: dihydropteroate synthase [Steroidobacteraceae bacterium]